MANLARKQVGRKSIFSSDMPFSPIRRSQAAAARQSSTGTYMRTECHPRLVENEGSLDGRAGRWRDLGVVRPDSSECGGASRPAAAICASHANPRGMYATAAVGGLDK